MELSDVYKWTRQYTLGINLNKIKMVQLNEDLEDEFDEQLDEMPTDEDLEKISNGDIEGDEI